MDFGLRFRRTNLQDCEILKNVKYYLDDVKLTGYNLSCGGGQGGWEPGRIWAGGVREAGGERAGSGIPRVAETGRKGEKFAILRNILQSTQNKEAGTHKEGGEKRE